VREIPVPEATRSRIRERVMAEARRRADLRLGRTPHAPGPGGARMTAAAGRAGGTWTTTTARTVT
jgi:hypothetical protein